MLASPFAFLRGAAIVMAGDLARTPSSGITVQLCGDCHLSNFGTYASPERDHYYWRQLRDMKGSAEVGLLSPERLQLYGAICGGVLARAHARAGDRITIAAYLGKSERFDEAVAAFAEQYADQTERDHAALLTAVQAGRVVAEIETGADD